MAQTPLGAQKTIAKHLGLTLRAYRIRLKTKKRCTGCKEWKPRGAFGADKTRTDGKANTCLDCRHVRIRKATKGRVSTFKGRRHTEEAKRLMSAAKAGRPSPLRGRKHSIEARLKMSATLRKTAVRGAACHTYKDGKVEERKGQRASMEYKRWRFDVFARDRFTCQKCGDDRGGNLHAHHIKPFADFPELRFVVSNGLTVCEGCHKKIHARGL